VDKAKILADNYDDLYRQWIILPMAYLLVIF